MFDTTTETTVEFAYRTQGAVVEINSGDGWRITDPTVRFLEPGCRYTLSAGLVWAGPEFPLLEIVDDSEPGYAARILIDPGDAERFTIRETTTVRFGAVGAVR